MKNAHPIVRATTSSPVDQDSTGPGSESAEPIIRLKLQKPLHWEWELTTSADALPVIQLLDKDGRLLVETTGRTAQRARGSFKKGLKTHEQFPIDESCVNTTSKEQTSSTPSMSSTASLVTTPLPINRNIDGFSTKFGTCSFAPRKSRSDVDIKERRSKKRHLPALEDPTMKTKIERNVEGAAAGNKKYSAGDYLRQQIVNDLRTRNTIGRTPEEIAKDRCKKVKAYLRSQSETLLSLVREEEYDEYETKDTRIGSSEKSPGSRSSNKSDTLNSEEKNPNGENKKAKPYLRTRSTVIPTEDSTKNNFKPNEGDRTVCGQIKNDMNEEELTKIRTFLREKIQRRMNMEQTRSRSDVNTDIPETVENARIRKRYSDYNYDRENYRTRKVRSETSILQFDPEMLEREKLKLDKQVEMEKSTNCRELSKASQLQRQPRNYRRSRSEALVEALELNNRPKSQVKRESSSLDRRKFYCKAKNDILQRREEAMSAVSAENLSNSPRRIKSQENVERSWREYKERKRSEKYRRESERELPEEDFMSKPRWKDLQRDLCSSRNCKICQNLKNCVNPLREKSREESEELLMGKKAANFLEDETSTNSSRPDISLQKNYLLLEKKNANSSQSSIIPEIQLKNRDNNIGSVPALNINSSNYEHNMNSSKSAFKNYRELYPRSNVKKSDTFKIVDGSEELKEHVNGSDMKINDGNGSDSDFGYLNGEGSLANKSNEDITKDYFKRVYELLKKRQEEMRKSANEAREFPGREDSSSSNYVEEIQKKKHRRKKKDKNSQGKIKPKKF